MTVACSTKWHTAGMHSRLKLLLLTQKHSFNLGSGCSVGSHTPLFFYGQYSCIAVRNACGWGTAVYCAYRLMLLFVIFFRLVRAVCKPDSMFGIIWTSNKRWPWGSDRYS